MLWYYYLTGDRRGLEVAQQWGTAAKNLFKKPFGHREGAGVTTSLIDLYRATWDPECKRIIDAEVNHFLDREQAMDGTRLCPSDIAGQVSHLTGKPMPRGAFAQWENYAPWLERYYELTGDTRAGERLVAWADAYIAGWGDSWSTFKPNAYINIMAYAYRVSRDPKYLQQGLQRTMEYVVSVQDSPGQLLDGFPHAGQISLGFCYMSARIPTLLAAIVEHGQPIEPAKVMPERQFTLPFTLDFSTGKKIRTFDVILREGQDNAFRILAEGGSTYKDKPVHVTITAPSGKKLIDQDILPKDGVLPLTFDIPADGETGDYRFQAAGEGSYWNIASTLRTDPALNRAFPFVGKLVNLNDCRYLFQVPTGVTAVQVTAEAGQYAMFAIRDPAGKLAARGTLCPGTDTGRVTVAVAVPAEHAGKLWTLDGDCGVASVTFTATGGAIPAVFAIHPDEFFVP
jgi:hypothetical protein